MDNQCANIFSTYATVYGSHSAMFAFYWKWEYFFFMCILNLVFFLKKNLVCVFLFIPTLFIFPKTVFLKTCFVFPIFIGGEACFLTFIVHRESYLYFLLLCCVCFLSTFWLGSLCQYVTKRERWNVRICGNPVCFI